MLSLSQINDYRASKGRDPLTSKPDNMAPAINVLDRLIREQLHLSDQIFLNNSTDPESDKIKIQLLTTKIDSIKKFIVGHPESSWTMSVLEYRIRQEFYK